MTTEEFREDWDSYAVLVDNEVIPLKERFMICWGYLPEIPDALLFDQGGEQGSPAYVLKVEDDHLVSVNPKNPMETSILGKLIKV